MDAFERDALKALKERPNTPFFRMENMDGVETFRYAFVGRGDFDPMHLAYSGSVILTLLIMATVIFNQVEKNFMDTV